MRLAIPDLVSPSYFPAAVMVELGFAEREGIDLAIDHLWPVGRAVQQLHDDELDLLAAPAHSAVMPGVGWGGTRLVAAISAGTFWFLVARSELGLTRGDLTGLSGLHVAAAPGPDLAFRQLLVDAGIDAAAEDISIGLPESVPSSGVSFGAWAATAMAAGTIDAFWANGMGAEMAVRSGTGTVVLDVRRGDGPPSAFNYTFPALICSRRFAKERPEAALAVARAMTATHHAIREDVEIVRGPAERLFPAEAADLIVDLVRRDLTFYRTRIDPAATEGVSSFMRALGLTEGEATYSEMVLESAIEGWSE